MLKLFLSVGLIGASYLLNAQEVLKKEEIQKSKANEKYLKHIKDATQAFKKNVQFAKEHNQKPPDEYFLQDYIATMDPETGAITNQKYLELDRKIEAGKYRAEKNLKLFNGVNGNSNSSKSITNLWVERGPYEVGGRVRGIMFDPNDPTGKKVWAGGVSGGLWYNNDITSATSEWTLVDGFWSNTSVSCITSDPNNPQIFYVGTGEVETGDISGLGIWKTTNGGTTWQQIFNLENGYASNGVKRGIYSVPDIQVVNNNGVSEVYAGVAGTYYGDLAGFAGVYEAGLYKSTDGTNFTLLNNLLSTGTVGYEIQDIEAGADNSIWVSTRRSYIGASASGGKIFRSTDHGATFTNVYDVGNAGSRVMIEVSNTNPLKAYALLQGATNTEPVRILKTIDGGTTWAATNVAGSGITLPNPIDTGQPDNDFTRGQAFYDLVIETDPENDEHIYVGGIDSYKSTDGGATWTQYTKWSNNNDLATASIPVVHADQHALVFNPKNPSQFVMGNDGGIFFAANKNNLANNTAVQMRNKRLNITQFYHGTLNPTATFANEEMILGAQDNGTKALSGVPLANNFYTSSEVYGGDGAYTAYDDQDMYLIASYVYNNHIFFNAQGAYYLLSANTRNNGQFINPLAVDRNLDIAYTNANSSNSTSIVLHRISGLTSTPLSFVRSQLTIATVTAGEFVTDILVSPYTTTSSTVFVGLSSGKLFKVTNANATHSISQINYNFDGYISDVKLGASENEIMVTVSNFNKTSVFYTTDGGTNWVSKEGNLPDIPVKAIFMNPEDNNEVILGTYFGVWGTANFQAASPTWALYSDGLGKFKVNHFDYRPSDKTILAVTYGRGAFTTKIDNTALATNEIQQNLLENHVYPNPTRGPLHIKLANGKPMDVEIFDVSGKLVMTKKNIKSDEEFDIEKLIKGDYVLKVVQNGNIVYTSVIIRK